MGRYLNHHMLDLARARTWVLSYRTHGKCQGWWHGLMLPVTVIQREEETANLPVLFGHVPVQLESLPQRRGSSHKGNMICYHCLTSTHMHSCTHTCVNMHTHTPYMHAHTHTTYMHTRHTIHTHSPYTQHTHFNPPPTCFLHHHLPFSTIFSFLYF